MESMDRCTDRCDINEIVLETVLTPLPNDKILDWSKLKQIADDILKYI